jgi:hypothetical protein
VNPRPQRKRTGVLAVASSDVLGSKVIKLNKIKGTQTHRSYLIAAQNQARAILSKRETSGDQRKPKSAKPKSRRFAVRIRTTKNLCANPSPNNRRRLDA